MNFSLYIARKLSGDKGNQKKVSRPAIRIATAGVAIGLAVMLISVCVMLGFKQEIRSKVIGFGSHVQIINYESLRASAYAPLAFNDTLFRQIRSLEGVAHIQRFCNKGGILKTDEAFKGVMLQGVDCDFNSTFLRSNLVDGDIPVFSADSSSNKVVISRQIADELRLKVGDKVYAYFFEGAIRSRRFTVAGIYQTNMTEFDKQLVFTDLYTCNRLNNWQADQCSGVEISLTDFDNLDAVSKKLIKLVNHRTDAYGAFYSAMTIKELYPQIFDWLNLLDMNVWVILILMVGVAGFTMISGLLIIILERTNFIGVMKALGATNHVMRQIFLYYAVFIIGKGLFWGNVFGLGLVLLQQYTGLIRLDAATYYVESVPVLINWGYILVINLFTFAASVLVLILPSFLISHIHPAKSIRFE